MREFLTPLLLATGAVFCFWASTLQAQDGAQALLELRKANIELRIRITNLEATVAERDARIVLLNDSLSKLLTTLITDKFGEASATLAEELRQINAEIADPLNTPPPSHPNPQ